MLSLWLPDGLLNDDDRGCAAPKFFKPIEVTLVNMKDVDNDILIVQDDPASSGRTFYAGVTLKLSGDNLINMFNNRADLAIIIGRTNNKVIGYRRQGANVEENDVVCLFVFDQFNDTSCKRCYLDDHSSG